jgi:hypothetical protein
MAGDIKLKYGTAAAFTVTNLHSLASSATNIAGWSSAAVDNATDLLVDVLISGEFKVSSSAPTANKGIRVYAYAAHSDTPTWPDLFSSGTEGAQGAATVHDEEQRDCGMVPLWACVVDAGTSEVYVMPPTSLAAAFGGVVPSDWALWVVQDTGQALASSGNALHRMPVLAQYT